jgi:hypothetical protein
MAAAIPKTPIWIVDQPSLQARHVDPARHKGIQRRDRTSTPAKILEAAAALTPRSVSFNSFQTA